MQKLKNSLVKNLLNINSIKKSLICPYCSSFVEFYNDEIVCINNRCKKVFPIQNGIPILLNEDNSIFRISDFLKEKLTTFELNGHKLFSIKNFLKNKVNKLLPSLSNNLSAQNNFITLQNYLRKKISPKVLIIGGGVVTVGTDILLKDKNILFVESDVSFGSRTNFILDCHNIPFNSNTFDCVILQAVLEHVLDPTRCIDEVHRVLNKYGLVYAATPFMQQVHMRKYDFTRFTYLGHRRLLRQFEEIESGIFAGTGVALGWSIRYFFRSLSNNKFIINMLDILSRLIFFWLKYIDYLTHNNTGTYDAASGFYFIGQKSSSVLKDKDLIKLYKGLK